MTLAPQIMGPDWEKHVRRMREREAAQRAYARSPEGIRLKEARDAEIRDFFHGLIVEGRLDEYRRLTQDDPSPLPPAPEDEPDLTVQVPDEADLAAEVTELADGGIGIGSLAWLDRMSEGA